MSISSYAKLAMLSAALLQAEPKVFGLRKCRRSIA
jgi:hypothetical protein